MHHIYINIKKIVEISKYLHKSCKGFTKLWKFQKSHVKFTLYLYKTYKRFKNNVGISKYLYKSCKGYTKL